MDTRLIGWARAVKARRVWRGDSLPVLWLFTDARRLPDPLPAVQRLPRGLSGVVLRDDALPGRRELGQRIAAVCRARRMAFAVAGDWRLAVALHAGLHMRGGRRPACVPRYLQCLTSSAHGVADLVRARRSGAALAFLSPVAASASHPGAPSLGPVRWGLMARKLGGAAALGGLDGRIVARLPRGFCRAAGAIGALR
jgi:thiamine-phosphate pyrophosphorylase